MNILITGGTGLIGRLLIEKLRSRGHHVRILKRSKPTKLNEYYWNLETKFIDDKAFENLDSIIHLAGASISKRWTTSYKKELFASRINTANLLKDYCKKNSVQIQSFISASGINYYGTFTSDIILDETSKIIQDDYLAKLCIDWENAAQNFSENAKRIICLRTSMVLAKNGGAFPMLKKVVNYNMGSAVGSGKQWMSWIHIDDLVNLYVFAVENEKLNGIYNAVADEAPTNKIFMKKLAKISRKYFIPINVPAFILKIIFGEMSGIILEGSRASNKKIKSQGFDFKYNNIEEAFKSLI